MRLSRNGCGIAIPAPHSASTGIQDPQAYRMTDRTLCSLRVYLAQCSSRKHLHVQDVLCSATSFMMCNRLRPKLAHQLTTKAARARNLACLGAAASFFGLTGWGHQPNVQNFDRPFTIFCHSQEASSGTIGRLCYPMAATVHQLQGKMTDEGGHTSQGTRQE